MKVGVTGHKGFIGSHLVKALKKREVELFLFDKPEYNLLKRESLEEFDEELNIIIHAAGVNRGKDYEIIAGNVVTTYNLIPSLKGKPKVIFLSSIHAKKESTYALSKRMAEKMLESFSKEKDFPVTIFRLTNVFGEGCRPFYNSVVATFCYQVAHGEELSIKGAENKIRFIYVEDVVQKIINDVFQKEKDKFSLKEISSQNLISVAELAQLIKSFKDIESEEEFESKFHKNLYKTYLSYKNYDL